jgi:GTPase
VIGLQASKVIAFIDLAGHEKYLKTTIYGMTSHAPDYGMLMIGGNMGIVGMTKGMWGFDRMVKIAQIYGARLVGSLLCCKKKTSGNFIVLS